jgi:hypothetical protein
LVEQRQLLGEIVVEAARENFQADDAAHEWNIFAGENVGAVDVRDTEAALIFVDALDGISHADETFL